MRIEIDEELCCGAGSCVLAAPTVFDQNDDGTVVLLDPAPGAGLRTAVREAAARCPTAAIRVV
ncbi:ferredoxin [Streptomyces sp. NEAU-sy36]|uniref:ferredoxin n=1 Tax=unclassified Streptomyces TaxID=2593676 RepID=UPI0015D5DB45|nr:MULTISPECIES: ferredoxin [unclassified Streptomyces]QLJ03461.1 ferredoxin [Streptomyces sp. NEAU-sy36]